MLTDLTDKARALGELHGVAIPKGHAVAIERTTDFDEMNTWCKGNNYPFHVHVFHSRVLTASGPNISVEVQLIVFIFDNSAHAVEFHLHWIGR